MADCSPDRHLCEPCSIQEDLLQKIVPVLRCVSDCQLMDGQTVTIRPDWAAIEAAARLLEGMAEEA